ncbi:MAG: arginine--tRNA ligase [Phycisphaerae bacterium]
MPTESLLDILTQRFASALARVVGPGAEKVDPQVRPSSDARFGDYQCNVAMSLARTLRTKPRELAEKIAAAVELGDLAEPLEIAGAGFINVRLRWQFVARLLSEVPPERPASGRTGDPGHDATPADPTVGLDRVGVPRVAQPQRVVIDYSSPNIAKQLHVGHLRSTIIGDVFARVLAFEGHAVIRQNHVGDWGTAIGMVILGAWYVVSRRLRGETLEAIEARLSGLPTKPAHDAPQAEQAAWSPDARRAALEPIRAEWDADLRSPNLARFDELFDALEIDIRALELGYKFVQKLVAAADGLGLVVTRPSGERDDLCAIPRIVTRDLQRGDPARDRAERNAWTRARAVSLAHAQETYARLGVLLTLADVCGESFYNDRLAPTLDALAAALPPQPREQPAAGPYAELRDDAGAKCVFLYDERHDPRFRRADGGELPMIVRKSDGAFPYASTDLAAARYRARELGAQRIVYVVGASQALHLQMLFAVVRAARFAGPDVQLQHTPFGLVLGPDGRIMKTRTGENVKLADLLDEAERRARAVLDQRPAADVDALSDADKNAIARRVGVAAVKYFDLNRDRTKDYVFDWDKMLSFTGNTAPYLLYAYARIRSIHRKAAERAGRAGAVPGSADGPSASRDASAARIMLVDASERQLALRLARFREALAVVEADLAPHVLCTYLYDLAADFMKFYEACPVLQAPDDETRLSRMRLCELAARTLRLGLWLLGIETLERM